MSLLGDISGQKYVPDHARILIHGQPGTGKTTLSGTIAELGKTLYLYVAGEEGVNSLAGSPHSKNLIMHKVRNVREFEVLWSDLHKGDHAYDCVVIESVSALQTMVKKHLLKHPMDEPYTGDRPATDFAFWGGLGDWFTDFFTFWYGLASSSANRPMHVVMTSQTKTLDDLEGDAKMQPDLHKTPLAAAISRPDQILYTHMIRDPDDFNSQRHVVRIKPSDKVTAKTRCDPELSEQLPSVIGIKNTPTLPAYLREVGVAGLD